jgi:hypothetical protein
LESGKIVGTMVCCDVFLNAKHANRIPDAATKSLQFLGTVLGVTKQDLCPALRVKLDEALSDRGQKSADGGQKSADVIKKDKKDKNKKDKKDKKHKHKKQAADSSDDELPAKQRRKSS